MANDTAVMMRLQDVAKTFVMHLAGATLPVLRNVTFDVRAGECAVLGGPSGTGKSSILKMIYGNYRADAGRILVRDRQDWVDMTAARPRRIIGLRRTAIGYISQFLRTIPRIGALDVVAAAARDAGLPAEAAQARASELLTSLNIPQRLWHLPPATFSGGEQQRINIARNLIKPKPLLLLDEPTASLDAANTGTVIELIREAVARGAAIAGIFHDPKVRAAVATRRVDVADFRSRR
jgi:alpha-D-ribose 1-methylphosphonate 5-triphosphate synthase subunit PhnL